MKLTIDTDRQVLTVSSDDGGDDELPLYSPKAFSALSRHWVRVGWALKQQYSFTWLGRPLIQLPEDVLRMQEVIHEVAPDVLIETGVAHGGSLVLYASLFEAKGNGRVVGVDVEIRPQNRAAIEAHALAHRITLVEGDSLGAAALQAVRAAVGPDDKVLVVLDSNHTQAHVAAELEAYAPLVSPGSYIVATDGIMFDLTDVPRGQASWREDNPQSAAWEFAARHPEFELVEPTFLFNEGSITERVTHWPSAFLRRR